MELKYRHIFSSGQLFPKNVPPNYTSALKCS
jgi:hypothetical protein